MKIFFNIIRSALAIVGFIALTIFVADWYGFDQYNWHGPEQEEFRLTSPGKEYDAVVTIQEPGAFGSSIVRLYVVPAEMPFDKVSKDFKFEALQSHTILVDRLSWRNDRTLIVIRRPQDEIYTFRPIQYDQRDIVPNKPDEKDWRRVTIILQTDENCDLCNKSET